MFYLDDGTLGGALTGVLHDLQLITKEAYSLVQQLNYGKSEIISNNSTIIQAMLIAVPELQVTDPRCTTLLGTPLGDIASIQCKNRLMCLVLNLRTLAILCTKPLETHNLPVPTPVPFCGNPEREFHIRLGNIKFF